MLSARTLYHCDMAVARIADGIDAGKLAAKGWYGEEATDDCLIIAKEAKERKSDVCIVLRREFWFLDERCNIRKTKASSKTDCDSEVGTSQAQVGHHAQALQGRRVRRSKYWRRFQWRICVD